MTYKQTDHAVADEYFCILPNRKTFFNSMVKESMIHAIYIINSAGIAIYERKYREIGSEEDQLISGFVTAIGQFSQHIFGEDVGQIATKKMQLIVTNDILSSLTAVLFADNRDSSECVKNIGLEILEIIKNYIREKNISIETPRLITDPGLDMRMDKLLKSKTRNRGYKRVILSAIGGTFTSVLIFILSILPIVLTVRIFPLTVVLWALFIFLIGAYTSGYLIADPAWGMRAGGLQYVILALLSTGIIGSLETILLLTPFMLSLAIFAGRYGGERGRRKWLYPPGKQLPVAYHFREKITKKEL